MGKGRIIINVPSLGEKLRAPAQAPQDLVISAKDPKKSTSQHPSEGHKIERSGPSLLKMETIMTSKIFYGYIVTQNMLF